MCVSGISQLYFIIMSLIRGKFPNSVKTRVIVSIPEVNRSKIPGDFRPMNLLPTMDKLIWTIVCNQLRLCLEIKNLIYIEQSGSSNTFTNQQQSLSLQIIRKNW